MTSIKEFHGCTMEVPGAGKTQCGVRDVCDICKLCEKHCVEHYQSRFGFRNVKTVNVAGNFKISEKAA